MGRRWAVWGRRLNDKLRVFLALFSGIHPEAIARSHGVGVEGEGFPMGYRSIGLDCNEATRLGAQYWHPY